MRLRCRGTGETRELRDGMILGRLATCDWLVEDASVSRRHARVIRDGETWLLEDLGSSNGTLLNGVRVPRLTLRAGDLVTLGSVAFDVLPGAGAPAPLAAPAQVPASAPGPAAAGAEHERQRLHADLRRRERSRGFGDLSQQSPAMKLLALLLGLAVLAGVTLGVRALAGVL